MSLSLVKPAILKAASEIQQVADDLAAKRIAADAASVEKMATAMASCLRALASAFHG